MSKQDLLDALKSETTMAEYLEVRDDSEIISDIQSVIPPGLTKRDYFAAAALKLLAGRQWDHIGANDADLIHIWAKSAYAIADAMIAASKSEAHHG